MLLLTQDSLHPAQLVQIPTYKPLGCPCQRAYSLEEAATTKNLSNCGPMAERRGTGQNVISFSIYGDISGAFFRGIAVNAELARRFYPGWVVRVYHNFSMSHSEERNAVCDVVCR